MEIAAYGSADAEARVEKELLRALPSARIDVRAIRRTDEETRIVESFQIDYLLRTEALSEGEDEESARRAAFAAARSALQGTRFQRISWERADLTLE